jgi:hypothetical protein
MNPKEKDSQNYNGKRWGNKFIYKRQEMGMCLDGNVYSKCFSASAIKSRAYWVINGQGLLWKTSIRALSWPANYRMVSTAPKYLN